MQELGLRGDKNFKPRPQNRFLVPLKGFFSKCLMSTPIQKHQHTKTPPYFFVWESPTRMGICLFPTSYMRTIWVTWACQWMSHFFLENGYWNDWEDLINIKFECCIIMLWINHRFFFYFYALKNLITDMYPKWISSGTPMAIARKKFLPIGQLKNASQCSQC